MKAFRTLQCHNHWNRVPHHQHTIVVTIQTIIQLFILTRANFRTYHRLVNHSDPSYPMRCNLNGIYRMLLSVNTSISLLVKIWISKILASKNMLNFEEIYRSQSHSFWFALSIYSWKYNFPFARNNSYRTKVQRAYFTF